MSVLQLTGKGEPAVPFSPEDYVLQHNNSLAYLVSLDRKHLAEKYAGAVNNYNAFVIGVGKDPGYPPPEVPIGPGLSPPDKATGLVSEIDDGGPVCDPLPIVPVPDLSAAPSNFPLIGKRLWANSPYFSADQRDAVPGGTEVTSVSADGVKGKFLKIGNPTSGGGGGIGGQGAVHGVYLLEQTL